MNKKSDYNFVTNEFVLDTRFNYTISLKHGNITLKADGYVNDSQNRNFSGTIGFVFKDYNDTNKNNGKEVWIYNMKIL